MENGGSALLCDGELILQRLGFISYNVLEWELSVTDSADVRRFLEERMDVFRKEVEEGSLDEVGYGELIRRAIQEYEGCIRQHYDSGTFTNGLKRVMKHLEIMEKEIVALQSSEQLEQQKHIERIIKVVSISLGFEAQGSGRGHL
jgi:hypothetical protein